MTFKIFRLSLAILILPLIFMPFGIMGALVSKDWDEYLDWWKEYFWY